MIQWDQLDWAIFWKVIFQVVAVITAVLPSLLDHVWHDKRTKTFKRVRLALYIFTALSLGISIYLTVLGEQDRRKEVTGLNTKLAGLNSKLDHISDLSEKMKSFLETRYPGVPLETALEKFKSDIAGLQNRTESLEKKSLQEEEAKKQLEALKKTPPQIKAGLKIIEPSGKIRIIIESLTFVPVKLNWRLVNIKAEILTGAFDLPTFHPKADPKFVREVQIDPTQVLENYLKLRINYSSIYAEEMRLPGLSGYIAIPYRLSSDGKSLTLIEKNQDPLKE